MLPTDKSFIHLSTNELHHLSRGFSRPVSPVHPMCSSMVHGMRYASRTLPLLSSLDQSGRLLFTAFRSFTSCTPTFSAAFGYGPITRGFYLVAAVRIEKFLFHSCNTACSLRRSAFHADSGVMFCTRSSCWTHCASVRRSSSTFSYVHQ